MDIVFFESTKNIAWGNILSTIRKDIRSFVEDGGWDVMFIDSDDEGEEER